MCSLRCIKPYTGVLGVGICIGDIQLCTGTTYVEYAFADIIVCWVCLLECLCKILVTF